MKKGTLLQERDVEVVKRSKTFIAHPRESIGNVNGNSWGDSSIEFYLRKEI